MKLLAKCDYCDFQGTIDIVLEHEKGCYCNPANKACVLCSHYCKRVSDNYWDDGAECDLGHRTTFNTLNKNKKCLDFDEGEGSYKVIRQDNPNISEFADRFHLDEWDKFCLKRFGHICSRCSVCSRHGGQE